MESYVITPEERRRPYPSKKFSHDPDISQVPRDELERALKIASVQLADYIVEVGMGPSAESVLEDLLKRAAR